MCKPSDEDLLAELNGSQVDGLISGFPCPPFSDMGSGHALNEQDKTKTKGANTTSKSTKVRQLSDARSLPMFAVIRWICLFAQRCGLQWFGLKNVPGILKRKRKEPQSFGEWLAAKLVQELEAIEVKGWQVRIIKHSSKDCFLPQHRPRVFFQGTSPDMRLTYLLTYCLSCLFIFAPLASHKYL